MIVSRIIGGLGNQMFQYAAGMSVARRLGVGHAVDASSFGEYGLRDYGLCHLNVSAPLLDDQAFPPASRSKDGLVESREGLRTVKEHGARFDPTLFTKGDNLYLYGYWQSPKYFEEIGAEIRAQFLARAPLTGEAAEWSRRIRGCQSVALHVRRGDYVQNVTVRRQFGLCTVGYYLRGIKLIQRQVTEPRFFVFSDDPDWVRSHLNIGGVEFVSHNSGTADFVEMQLMASCRHFIIANSSFSWWAAWLSPVPDKRVLAPDPWFLSPRFDMRDLIPAGWVKIPAHAPIPLLRSKIRRMLKR